MFAKIFESEKCGQILVFKDTTIDDKPCIKFVIEPQGFDACSISPAYPNDENGFDTRDHYFLVVDIEIAESFAAKILELIQE